MKAAVNWYLAQQKAERLSHDAEPKRISREERLAYVKLRREAQAAGASLANGGRGGLPHSLALKVFRRDGYRCKVHGDHGEGENGGLSLHHKGGIHASERLESMGHRNVHENLVTLCKRAHSELHEAAKAQGIDSSQQREEAPNKQHGGNNQQQGQGTHGQQHALKGPKGESEPT